MEHCETFAFWSLESSHFPLLLQWLQEPHVKAWWDQEMIWSLDRIEKKYSAYIQHHRANDCSYQKMHAHLIALNDQPIGYIQHYNVRDYPREDGPEMSMLPYACAAVDMYIGVPDLLGRGLGSQALAQYCTHVVWKNFNDAFVDPDSRNVSAIRAYEKAGFAIRSQKPQSSVTWMIRSKAR